MIRRQVGRAHRLLVFSRLPPCLIGMEAPVSGRIVGRALARSGHEVRQIPPAWSSGAGPMMKRTVARKPTPNAAAIRSADLPPPLRFVPAGTEGHKAMLMSHQTQGFPPRPRPRLADALRANLGEFSLVVPKGVHNMKHFVAKAPDRRPRREYPSSCWSGSSPTGRRASTPSPPICAAKADETARLLRTMPGSPPITAGVMATTLPDVSAVRPACDLSAWPDTETAAQQRKAAAWNVGNHVLRRPRHLGATGDLGPKRADPGADWLGHMLALKGVALARANRMAGQTRAKPRSDKAGRAA